MKPATRALIWEQWRVAGVTAVTLFGVAFVLMTLMWVQYLRFQIHEGDARNISLSIAVGATLAAAAIFMLRFDTVGHLTAGFEKRLARLPVRTLPLVTIPFVTRLAYLVLLVFALALLHTAFFAESPRLFFLLLPINLYAMAQAYAWSRKAITGLDYALPLLILLAPLVLFGFESFEAGYLGALALLARGVSSPLLTPVVLLAGFGLGLLGVSWERRDIRRGLPTVTELRDFLTGRFSITARHTQSPLAAMVWYESRRMGARMPLVYLALVVLGFVITLSIPEVRKQASVVAQLIPLLALPIAALVGGAPALWAKSRYALLRPLETRTITQAKLIAAARVLTWTTLLATVLSLAGFYIAARETEVLLIQQAYAAGEISLIEIASMLLGPCLMAFAIAWTACSLGTAAMGVLVGCTVLVPLLAGVAGVFVGGSYVQAAITRTLAVAVPCLLAGGLLLFAARKHLAGRGTIALLSVLWVAVVAFLYVIAPDTIEVHYHVQAAWHPVFGEMGQNTPHMEPRSLTMPMPWWAAAPALVVGAFIIAPFVSIAHSAHRRRTA